MPSVAFSQDLTGELFDRVRVRSGLVDPPLLEILRTSARHAARLAPELILATPARSFVVHNVNFPLSAGPIRQSDERYRRALLSRAYLVPRRTMGLIDWYFALAMIFHLRNC